MKYPVYPSWDDIKYEIPQHDLLDIISDALVFGDIDTAVSDYIEENYEPEYEEDVDAAYDAYKDDLLLGGLE